MSSPRRVVIVDYNHMAYKVSYGTVTHALTHRIKDESHPEGYRTIVTNIQNSTLKNIHRWTRGGTDIPAICFDRPCPARREYFDFLYPSEKKGTGYKAERSGMPADMREAINMTMEMLLASGISCYAANNYEADDLVKAAIDAAKAEYGDMLIDVVTGDSDLIPLVDDQVSVFMTSRRGTFAEEKDLRKTNYMQVTPRNYEDVVSELSKYKTSKLRVPYNMLLLVKMLRGDPSDNIPAVASGSMTPTKVRSIIENFQRVSGEQASNAGEDAYEEALLAGADSVSAEQARDEAAESAPSMAKAFTFGADLDFLTYLLASEVYDDSIASDMFSYLQDGLQNTGTFPSLFDERQNMKPSVLALFESKARGTGKDGLGGIHDMEQARKNFCLMDLNMEFTNGLRKSGRVATPKPYDEMLLAQVAADRLNIKIPVGSL